MINITLQREEADAVERILDLILTNEQAASAVFRDGSEMRSVRRVSKKLHWAKQKEEVA
jgi:hypothetical protein